MKYKMEQLINRSYQAIKGRGLIDENTTMDMFLDKIMYEYYEAHEAMQTEYMGSDVITTEEKAYYLKEYIEEITDIATVCIMQIHHLGYDFIEEFEKVVIKNEKRANEISKRE